MAAPKRREDPSLDAFRAGQAAAAKYRDQVAALQPAAATTTTEPAEAPSETDLAAAEQQQEPGTLGKVLGAALKPAESWLGLFGKDVIPNPLPGKGSFSIDDALNAPADYTLQPAVGHLAQFLARHNLNFGDSEETTQRILDADSGLEAWEAAFADKPGWEKFVAEAAVDPLNLLGGIGAGGRGLAKGLGLIDDAGRGAKLARGLDTVSRVEDLANAGMALPLTGPFKAAGFGLKNTVGRGVSKLRGEDARPLLGIGKRGERNQAIRSAEEAFEFARSRGATTGTLGTPEGNVSRYTGTDILNTLQQMPTRADANGYLSRLPDADIGRAWVDAGKDPAQRPLYDTLTSHLKNEGLIVEGNNGFAPTQRLNSHMYLDETLDSLGVSSTQRDISHAMVDIAALGLYSSNRKMFRTVEDAYSAINVQRVFGQDQFFSSEQLFSRVSQIDQITKILKQDPNADLSQFVDASGQGWSPEVIDAAKQFYNFDVEGTLERARKISQASDVADPWYLNMGKAITMAGFRDDVPAFTDEVIARILHPQNIDPAYSVKGVNPYIDQANRWGFNVIENVDPELAQRAGIDLAKYQGVAPSTYPKGPTGVRLDPNDTVKYLAERMRGVSQLRMASLLWGVGGNNLSPEGNLPVFLGMWKNMVVDGQSPSSWMTSPIAFEQARRAAFNQTDALLNGDFHAVLLDSPDFRYPGTQQVLDFTPDTSATRSMAPEGQSASEIASREVGNVTSVNPFQDKIFNYTEAVYEHAVLVEQYNEMLRMAGTDQRMIDAANQFLETGVAAINGFTLDRHMWRFFNRSRPQAWADLKTGELKKDIVKGLDKKEGKGKGYPEKSPNVQEWIAAKILGDHLFRITRNDPILSKKWRNAHEVQAGLWFQSFLDQDWGLGKALGELIDTTNPPEFSDDLMSSVLSRSDELWDSLLTPEFIKSRSMTHGNTMLDFIGNDMNMTLLRASGVQPRNEQDLAALATVVDKPVEELRTLLNTPVTDEELAAVRGGKAMARPEVQSLDTTAIQDLIARNPVLNQTIENAVRGSFSIGADGPLIRLGDLSDPTTLPHELAHLVRQTLGPEDQRMLAESFGREFGPGTSDVEAEEWFAEAFENLLRTGDISSLPPALQEAIGKWRQISQLVYKRQASPAQMDNQLGQTLLDRLSGIRPRFRPNRSPDNRFNIPRAGREVGGPTGTGVPSPATADALTGTTPTDLVPTPGAPVGSTDLRRSGFLRRPRRTVKDLLPDPEDRRRIGLEDADDVVIQPEGYVDPAAYREGVNTPQGPRQPNPIDPEYADVPWDDPDLQTLLNNPNFQKIQEAADDSIRRTMRNEAVDDRTILQTGKMTRREVAETMSDQDLETMVVDILDLMDKGIYPQTDGIAATMEVIGEIYNRRFRNVTQDAAASVEPAVARDLAKSPGRVTPSAIFPANDTIDEAVQAERARRGLSQEVPAGAEPSTGPIDVEATLSDLRAATANVKRNGRMSASELSDFQVEDYANRLKQAMDEGWTPSDEDEAVLQLLQREYESRFDQPLFQNTPGTSAAGGRVRQTARTVANADEAKQVIQRGEYVTLSAWRTGVDDVTNQSNTTTLEQMIRDAGYEPYRTDGVYGGSNEPSFFVPGMDRQTAIDLGNRFNQESILNGTEGLVYMSDGTVNLRQGRVQFQSNPTDNFSRVHLPDGSTVSFTQDMNFAEAITPDSQIKVDDNVFLDPSRPGDSIKDVLSQYAVQNNLPVENAERVAAAFEPVTTLNPEHFAAQELIDNEAVLRHIEAGLRTGDEKDIRQGVGDALSEMNQHWEAFGTRHPAAYKFVKPFITSTPQGRSQQRSRLAGRSRLGSDLIDSKAERIREVFQTDEVQAFEKQYEADKQAVQDAIFSIRQADPRARSLPEITDLTTMGDIRKYADFTQNADLKKTINEFFKEYDVDTTVWEAFKGDVLTAYQKSLEKKLGIPQKPHKAYERVWNNVTSAWREQALLSPKNTGLNVLDMAFKSVVHGVNFMVPRDAAQMQAGRWGHEIPITARTDAGFRVGGQREEFARQGEQSALGRVLPSVAGDAADRVVQWKRGVDRMFEDVFRQAAWRSRTQQHLEQAALPRFRGEIRRAAAEYGGETDRILRDLKSFGSHAVDYSPDDVYKIATAAGMGERGARNLSTRWGHYIQEASDEGVKFSNKVHFDVYDERYIEELLHVRSWAPFHFFMTRNIPYYMETMAAHPALFRIWRDYDNLSDEEKGRLGLTDRFTNTIPMDIPLAGGILDVLLGPGTAYANPMVVMSIADQFRPQYTEDDATLVGKIADAGSNFGVSPAPWISVPLQAFGAYGPNAEAPNLLRHSRLVKATTGFDPEALPKRGVQWLQSQSTGKSLETITGSAIKDYQINKRVAELSIERTGRANHPEYVAAFDNPDNPIWQMAKADVDRQEQFDAIYGFVSPVPLKYLPDTEALIRSQRQLLPGSLSGDPRKAVVESGVPAGGYLKVPYHEAESSAERRRYSGSGSGYTPNPDTAWGGEIWGPGHGGFFGDRRAYNQYLDWRGRMPDGTDTSPNAFLDYIRTTYPIT